MFSSPSPSSVPKFPTVSKDDDGSENLSSFKPNRVYLDPLRMSNAGDFSWS